MTSCSFLKIRKVIGWLWCIGIYLFVFCLIYNSYNANAIDSAYPPNNLMLFVFMLWLITTFEYFYEMAHLKSAYLAGFISVSVNIIFIIFWIVPDPSQSAGETLHFSYLLFLILLFSSPAAIVWDMLALKLKKKKSSTFEMP